VEKFQYLWHGEETTTFSTIAVLNIVVTAFALSFLFMDMMVNVENLDERR
jgi:hypothetical protein